MDTQEKLIIAGLLIATVIVTALVMTFVLRVPSIGTIKTIGLQIYTDSTGTTPLTQISWGFLGPGDIAIVTAYMKSVSNTPVNITMVTQNWNPSIAATYITLTWDYPTGRILQPGEMIAVKFTLTVSSSISGIIDFAFDIMITASG